MSDKCSIRDPETCSEMKCPDCGKMMTVQDKVQIQETTLIILECENCSYVCKDVRRNGELVSTRVLKSPRNPEQVKSGLIHTYPQFCTVQGCRKSALVKVCDHGVDEYLCLEHFQQWQENENFLETFRKHG